MNPEEDKSASPVAIPDAEEEGQPAAAGGGPVSGSTANVGTAFEVPPVVLPAASNPGELDQMRSESYDVVTLLSNRMLRDTKPSTDRNVAGAGKDLDVQGPIDWIGEPIQNMSDFGGPKTCYAGFCRDGLEVSIGDFVYVETGERVKELEKIELYIGQVKELYDSHTVSDQEPRVAKMATIQWYYRPEELDLDAPLYVFDKEVFRGDEVMPVPLHMVVGRCRIVSPKEYWDNKVSAAARKSLGIESDLIELKAPADVFVCSKEYLKEDRRVVPLDDVLDDVPPHARDYRLEDKVLHPPKGLLQLGGGTKDGKGKGKRGRKPGIKVSKPAKTARGAKRRANSSDELASSDVDGDASKFGRGAKGNRTSDDAEDDLVAPKPVRRSRGGRIIKEPKDSYSIRDYSNQQPGADSIHSLPNKKKSESVSRGKYGRWAPDRFLLAQKNLVDTMKLIGATHPHKAVLRPKLRDEARRQVGDTGLLDYLLKHLADEVVSPEGEKLRRRHNATGHMEYWLQDPSSAHEEDMMVNNEINALSAELRQVREARNLLQSVREEAAQVARAVEGAKSEPMIPANGTLHLPSTADQIAFDTLKASHESYVKRCDSEIKDLRQAIATLSRDYDDVKSKLVDMTSLMDQIKDFINKGKLDSTLDDILTVD
jgi:prefoldin subunit 5